MTEFIGLAVGGPLSGCKLRSMEPTKRIPKKLPPPIMSKSDILFPEVSTEIETFDYILVPGIRGIGGGNSGMFQNFWVPVEKAKFKNGQWTDNGWAASHILNCFYNGEIK